MRKGLLLVPEEAVLQRADGEIVFRATRDNKVERVVVKTGVHKEGLVEIASGLRPDDVVVTRGQAGLTDGLPVSPRNPDGTPLASVDSNAPDVP
jgi:membrane fusion protein, multidrug efflux system